LTVDSYRVTYVVSQQRPKCQIWLHVAVNTTYRAISQWNTSTPQRYQSS